MATSIELHRSSLYLKFSPECLPYAEVAQFYLSTKPRDTLVLGCDSNLLMPSPSLILPKGIYADSKTTLNTKIAILRLFDRIANTSRTVETNYKINETINSFKEGADWKKILNPKTKYLVGESISMADLLGWDLALKHEIDTAWTKSISKTPELLEAKRTVDKVVNAIPKVDYYKFHVMKQVALATNADPQDISKASLVPKFKEQGDFAVPIPALKLQGNPAELAKTIAEHVIES